MASLIRRFVATAITASVTGVTLPSLARIDQSKDTIKIRRSREASEDLKVQDGLLFNAVRYGDLVEVTVEDINGARPSSVSRRNRRASLSGE
jgi:hypothetical protein